MLVLLPGSPVTPQSIELIRELTIFDAYMARTRLCTQLPMVLGPCPRETLTGDNGDRMERVGIRFVGVSKAFLDQPVRPLPVTACQIESEFILVSNADGQERIFPVARPILLLEGRYDIGRHRQNSDRRNESDRLMEAVLTPTPASTVDTGLRQVLFIYSKSTEHPAELIDSRLDYSLLGQAKALTTAENFRTLLDRMSETFGSPIVREMIRHSYALVPMAEDESHIESDSSPKSRGKKRDRHRSNRRIIRFMSRLLYCQWMRENGWTGRVFPD